MKKFPAKKIAKLLAGLYLIFPLLSWRSDAANVPVQVVGFSFSPKTVTINVGDTITWMTPPSGGHDIEADDGTFKSPPPGTFSTFSFTFTQAKTITYRCNPHAVSFNMRGTIIVQAAANQPPTVSLTSPSNGATFSTTDSITITADPKDPDGSITKVEFFDGANSIGSKTAAPFSISTTLSAGQHSLTAKATDNGGATTTSAAVTITVNAVANNPPTVSITSPADNSAFEAPASVTIEANPQDSDGTIAKVEFFDGLTSLGVVTATPYSIKPTLQAGKHPLTAVATDNSGASTTSAIVNVNVASRPTLVITRISPTEYKLTATGTQTVPHTIQGSTDLAGGWNDLTTISPPRGGAISFTDTVPAAQAFKFYRIVIK
jgi:plastocyanin